MSWDITHVIETLLGVIIGGVITLLVNLHLQRKEREIQYAIQNKRDIYEPLYDEVKQKLKALKEFSDPFNAATTLRTWADFKPSIRLRVLGELRKLIQEFDERGKEYYELHWKAGQVLRSHIDECLNAIRSELDEREYSGGNFDILKQKIFEACAGDFYSGRILREKRHAYAPERMIKLKSDSSLTFEEFFHRVCSSIENEQAIIDLRKARGEIIEATEKLERYLKAKIDFIFEKYEGKLAKV
ncbi:MAG: hypothetical protein WBW48_13935 [Anaerolineae bacterium]